MQEVGVGRGGGVGWYFEDCENCDNVKMSSKPVSAVWSCSCAASMCVSSDTPLVSLEAIQPRRPPPGQQNRQVQPPAYQSQPHSHTRTHGGQDRQGAQHVRSGITVCHGWVMRTTPRAAAHTKKKCSVIYIWHHGCILNGKLLALRVLCTLYGCWSLSVAQPPHGTSHRFDSPPVFFLRLCGFSPGSLVYSPQSREHACEVNQEL